MSCDFCGARYPAGADCPQCGAQPRRPAGFLPLRGLGNALVALLGLTIAAIAATLSLRQLGETGLRWHDTVVSHWFATFGRGTMLVLAIPFFVWFRRARINAERHGYRQRRARGWTFWGWIIPIVSLWFPFQLMGDIWRAGLPAEQRDKMAWLPALWWTCWLLSGVAFGRQTSSVLVAGSSSRFGDAWSASLYFLAAAGVLLIVIIRRVSGGPVGSALPADAP